MWGSLGKVIVGVLLGVIVASLWWSQRGYFADAPMIPGHSSAPSSLSMCPGKLLARALERSNFTSHGFTSRDWRMIEWLFHPPFFNASERLAAASRGFHLLDIGTGSGRVLLELQYRFPWATMVGTNSLTYPHSQAMKADDLLSACAVWKIPVHCRLSEDPFWPILPKIRYLDVSSPFFRGGTNAAFGRHAFDFVFSSMALNGPSKTIHHPYLPHVVSLMAPGSVAVLHIGDASFKKPVQKRIGDFGIIDTLSKQDLDGRRVDFVMTCKFAPYNWPSPFYFVVVVAKVCLPSELSSEANCAYPTPVKSKLGLKDLVKENVHAWPVVRNSLADFCQNLALFPKVRAGFEIRMRAIDKAHGSAPLHHGKGQKLPIS
jgi:hypothetical protein